jgi:hypothetical protein
LLISGFLLGPPWPTHCPLLHTPVRDLAEWVHLVLKLKFGKHVSSHDHAVKGLITAHSSKSPTWVLHRAKLIFYWMPMCPHSLYFDAWDKVSTVFIPFLGFWNFKLQKLWIHLIGCSSIQCQLQLVYFITLYQRSVTPYLLNGDEPCWLNLALNGPSTNRMSSKT